LATASRYRAAIAMARALSMLLLAVFVVAITDTGAKAVSWGEPDLTNRYPYAVMLATPEPGTELAKFCSGVLLDTTHVLTAAHCVNEGEFTFVFVGMQANLVSVALLPADGSHIHPDFVAAGSGPDIAVLKLAFPVTGVGAASLPDAPNVFDTKHRGPAADRIFEIIGYGTQGVSALSTPDKDKQEFFGIRQVGQQILLSINQGVGGGDYVQLSSNAGFDGGACLGDSGGPVIPENTDTVVAINSSGTSVNCAGMSVSSRVDIPAVLSFIDARLSD
jgi:secreted trypsin-like serine protease